MAYTPPDSTAVNLDIGTDAYTPPDSTAVNLQLGDTDTTEVVGATAFENTTDVEATALWFAELSEFENTTTLDPVDVVLIVEAPAFENTTALAASWIRRLPLAAFEQTSALAVDYIYQVPEGYTPVGPPPFENTTALERPTVLHSLPVEFNQDSDLATPVIIANNAADIVAPDFENTGSLEADLAPLLSVPSFEGTSDLDILAIKLAPAGDQYTACPPFEQPNVFETPVFLVAFPPPEFENTTVFSITGIYSGFLVEAPAFENTTTMESSVDTGVYLTVFETFVDLEVSITPGVSIPDFEGTTDLEVGIQVGEFIAVEEFTNQTILNAGISVYDFLPEFNQDSDLENPVILAGFLMPEFNSTTALSVGDIYTFSLDDLKFYYILTITGAADGVEDVEIPFVSFQSRRRSGADTYLQVVIPSTEFIDDIVERENGTMRVDQAYIFDGDILQREAIIETTMDQVNPYQGGDSDSLILIGYTTTIYTPKTVEVYNGTYRAQIDGKLSYRLPTPDIFLNPGDTVIIGDDEFVLGVMSYTVSGTFQQIDLTEA